MASLSLSSGIRGRFRASAANATEDPSTGSVNYAAFSPGATQAMETGPSSVSPTHAFGLTLWVGVGALVLLVVVRQSLPR